MSAGERFWRWIERQLPPNVTDVGRSRARAFVVTAWLALALSVVSALLAAGSSLWALGALNVVDLIVCVWMLRAFRVRADAAITINRFLGVFTVTLSLGSLTTTPMELTTLSYLLLIPLISALMLDPVQTRRWFVRVVVAGAAVIIAGHAGLLVPQADPFPLFTRVMNFVSVLAGAVALLDALAREQLRAIERIQQAERAKSAFLANIGHEIRTPMNGVLGMTDALLGRPLGLDERSMVETIRASGGLLLALIDDLLDLSKLEARRLVLHEAPLRPAELADDLQRLWSPVATRKGLTLKVTVYRGLPAALVLDGLRLRQILGNLISNAIKYTEKGGVTVHLDRGEGVLSCVVEDTGVGISAEQQRQLFARFAQVADARVLRSQGAGLGLVLSRELAVHMGGTLELESTPGVGSRFTCRLPLVAADAPIAPAQTPVAIEAFPRPLRVLVVDDNSVNLLVARRLLEQRGCAVQEASDGQSALDAVSRERFDVVLMDVYMPDMDGLEATRQIRARGDTASLPIIGLSASADPEEVRNCRDAGMTDFLAKPLTAARLVETLRRHV